MTEGNIEQMIRPKQTKKMMFSFSKSFEKHNACLFKLHYCCYYPSYLCFDQPYVLLSDFLFASFALLILGAAELLRASPHHMKKIHPHLAQILLHFTFILALVLYERECRFHK